MTFAAAPLTVPAPAFRTVAEAQAWADALYGWAVSMNKRFNALLVQTRLAPAAAIADMSLAVISDPSAPANIADPADAPADADELRDDLVASTIPSIESVLATLRSDIVTSINDIEARFTTIQTAFNSLLAAARTNGIVGT